MDGAIAPAMADAAAASSPPSWATRAREMLAQDEWTTADLALLELAILPASVFRIRDWLDREGVLFREEARNGGPTRLYNLYAMPAALRRAIAGRLAPFAFDIDLPAPGAPVAARASDLRALEGLTGKLALRAQARLAAIRAFEAWSGAAGLVGGRGEARFADLYAGGAITVPGWLRAALPSFSAKSLNTWRRTFREDGLRALAGDYKPKVSKVERHDALMNLGLGLFAEFPHITAARMHEQIAEHAAALDVPVPSLRGVQRWLKGWLEQNRLQAAHARNPDDARSRYMPAFGDAGMAARELNGLWEMDTTPFDILLADGRRWTIIGIIDVWSRDLIFRLAETTSGHRARTALRHALMELGVPRVLRTDNGSDLRNRETEALLQALGIALPPMPVGRPDKKPFIERVFRTLQHDLVPLLPGFAGHNVAEAQALRSRVSFMRRVFDKGATAELRLTPAQAQAFLDAWVAGYRRREHRSLGCTPSMQRAKWTGQVRRIEDARALDMLLAPLAGGDGWRSVGKKGIAAEGGVYAAAELGDRVGQRVLCRMDPADAGRIYVYDEDHRFLCVAEDWRLTGADPQALAEAAKATWRGALKAGAAELREKGRRIDKATIAMEMANRRAAGPAAVVPFPRPAETHATPALAEAARAARVDEAPVAPARTAADARRAEWVAEKAARAAQSAAATSEEAQKAARLARARAVRDAIGAGHPVPEADARWFEAYATGAEWRWACTVEGMSPTPTRNPA